MIDLTPEKALIFRITHIENVPWILENGIHCCNSTCRDPNFCQIGNPDLIDKRTRRVVPIAPGGVLSNYVPFYFTPHSPMLFNIKTGYNNMRKTPMPDIAVLVTSLHRVKEQNLAFVFSDRHAYLATARFYVDLRDLETIDWPRLKSRDFKRDPDEPAKFERYQAEALIHGALPVSALSGIACYGPAQVERLQGEALRLAPAVKVVARPQWYF